MLSGLLDPARLVTFPFPAPLDVEDVAGADVVQVVWELVGARGEMLLSPALHPTQPTLLSLLLCGDQVQVRLSCRHGARARAMVVASAHGATFDGEVLRVGDAVVRLTGEPRDLGSGDMQFVASLWPVDVDGRGPRLVQQEFDVEVSSLQRWRAVVEAWPSDWPQPATLVGAGVAHGNVHLPAPRFMSRADVWAHEGSERV